MTRLTGLGKQLHILRLENDEQLKDMADVLHVGAAYLSSIEHGSNAPTTSLLNKIKASYNLDENKTKILNEAFWESYNNFYQGVIK